MRFKCKSCEDFCNLQPLVHCKKCEDNSPQDTNVGTSAEIGSIPMRKTADTSKTLKDFDEELDVGNFLLNKNDKFKIRLILKKIKQEAIREVKLLMKATRVA